MRALSRPKNFGLPLLAKELIEQAARRRTYVIRVVYACVLFLTTFIYFFDIFRSASIDPLAVLGRGKEIFERIVHVQFAGIYLLMPAMTSGVLTIEKERATLPLLFLTRLGPWTILLEKLASRVIPMIGFLLMSVPLLAIAYTLGGVTSSQLGSATWMLFLTVFQVGTMGLLCSAWFRTTAGAFMASYLLGAVLVGGPFLFWLSLDALGGNIGSFLRSIAGPSALDLPFVLVLLFPLGGFAQWIPGPIPLGAGRLGPLAIQSILILSTSAACLGLARLFVVRRASLPSQNALLAVFRQADRLFQRLNANFVTRGIVFGRDRPSLPEDKPIAWRETQKKALGRSRYLIRVFLALEIPLSLVCVPLLLTGWESPDMLAGVTYVLWGIVVLTVAVQSSTLVAAERSRQTLDVLCTTPLSGQQIVLEKQRGVLRLKLVLSAALATIFLIHWNVKSSTVWSIVHGEGFDSFLYLTVALLSVAIYLPLVSWVSIAIGLVSRTQGRAIVTATAYLVVWSVAPLLLVTMPLNVLLRPGWSDLIASSALLSPATIIAVNEYDDLPRVFGNAWRAVIANFTLYGSLLLLVRSVCLRNADRWLGRVGPDGPTNPAGSEVTVGA